MDEVFLDFLIDCSVGNTLSYPKLSRLLCEPVIDFKETYDAFQKKNMNFKRKVLNLCALYIGNPIMKFNLVCDLYDYKMIDRKLFSLEKMHRNALKYPHSFFIDDFDSYFHLSNY